MIPSSGNVSVVLFSPNKGGDARGVDAECASFISRIGREREARLRNPLSECWMRKGDRTRNERREDKKKERTGHHRSSA